MIEITTFEEIMVGDTVIADVDINKQLRKGIRCRVIELDTEYHEEDGEDWEVLYIKVDAKLKDGSFAWISNEDEGCITVFR